jgi:hypothetical protein
MNKQELRDEFRRVARRYAVLAYCILVAAVAIAFATSEQAIRDARDANKDNAVLIQENIKRVNEIQQSRLYSCVHTYKTMRKVLIVSANGLPLTLSQRKRFDELLDIANPAKCVKQVGVTKGQNTN